MSIEIEHINKQFGDFTALGDVSVSIPSGELVALLGPSGCGKTTLLRIIAGLETPDKGRILFNGEDTTESHVRERRVGFVFQHYALFRHMTVFDNVAFGLNVRPRQTRPSKTEIREKVMKLRNQCVRYPRSGRCVGGGRPDRDYGSDENAVSYVRSHDIEIYRKQQDSTSLRAEIRQILKLEPTVRVTLSIEGKELVEAELTRDVFQNLGLQEGEQVYARPRQAGFLPRITRFRSCISGISTDLIVRQKG